MNEAASEKGESPDAPGRPDGDGDLIAALKNELAAKERRIFSLEAALTQRETEIRGLESTIASVYASTTWKLGAPLRLTKRLLRWMANPSRRRQPAPEKRVAGAPGGDVGSRPANYPEWQRLRLAERLRAAQPAAGLWNHLITIVVFADERNGITHLPATLASLHRQTYRNIEVLIAGMAADVPPALADFSRHRGLFVEPALDPLNLLTSSAAARLWRGSHLAFARAGTEFAADAFALFNAALNPAGGAPAPDLVVCDHDRLDGAGDVTTPSLVPGWDPDFICALDYVLTAFVTSRALVLEQRTAARPGSLHDWLCRIARRARQPATGHVAEPLVHMPASTPQPVLAPSMPAVLSAASVTASPALAIVIPNRNKPELLQRCLRFLEFENRFRPEVVVVDNASDEVAVRTLYRDLRARYGARVIQMDQSFNFSRMVNLGVAATSAELVLLLNNDVEITTPGLVEQMIAHAVRPEIGVVGSRLMYPAGTVQHAGMLLRPGGSQDHPVRVEHVLRGAPTAAEGYLYQLRTIRNYQCVTGALQMMRRDVFEHVGGFDEVAFPVEYGDVDFCLRVRRAGWRVIALPLDGILHPESSTRGTASPPAVVAMRTAAMKIMAERWPDPIARDPYRNAWVEAGEVPEARFPWSAGAAS